MTMEVKNRYYYTLEDLIKGGVLSDGYNDLELGNAYKTTGNFTVTEMLAKYLVNNDITVSIAAYNKTEMNALICSYIYPKYKTMYISYVDKDNDDAPTAQEISAANRIFVRNLLNRIRTTYDEYKKMIDLYDSIKSNLLDEIKSQTKFNDTPQTSTSAGVTTYDDTYNSNVTTTYNDGASKIARLKEVEDYIRDYYEKWCNVVTQGLFIYD